MAAISTRADAHSTCYAGLELRGCACARRCSAFTIVILMRLPVQFATSLGQRLIGELISDAELDAAIADARVLRPTGIAFASALS